MATVNPYLNFNGNTEEAFNFYRSVIGGEFTTLMRFSDTGESENMSKEDQNKIMHIALPVGDNILMGTDALESMGHSLQQGNNLYIAIAANSKEEADKLYNGLSEGGKIEMELQDTFWGSYYGSFTDKFGVQWMIDYVYDKQELVSDQETNGSS